jgi:hypothetical protein
MNGNERGPLKILSMMPRFALAALVASIASAQIDCIESTVSTARAAADVVFKGKVAGYREASDRRYVEFTVDRVWKGDVRTKIELPALVHVCIGFPSSSMIELGSEVLVYARRVSDTYLIERAQVARQTDDFRKLGHGRKPKP